VRLKGKERPTRRKTQLKNFDCLEAGYCPPIFSLRQIDRTRKAGGSPPLNGDLNLVGSNGDVMFLDRVAQASNCLGGTGTL
jgi:hypothetical protein